MLKPKKERRKMNIGNFKIGDTVIITGYGQSIQIGSFVGIEGIEQTPPSITGKVSEIDKAKSIYEFIQKNIKWNKFWGIYSSDGIGKALDSKSGSVADINFALGFFGK